MFKRTWVRAIIGLFKMPLSIWQSGWWDIQNVFQNKEIPGRKGNPGKECAEQGYRNASQTLLTLRLNYVCYAGYDSTSCWIPSFLQDVSFNKTFQESPVVLVSVNHRYDRQAKGRFLPENNIISTWVEVDLCFVLYIHVIRHSQIGKVLNFKPRLHFGVFISCRSLFLYS